MSWQKPVLTVSFLLACALTASADSILLLTSGAVVTTGAGTTTDRRDIPQTDTELTLSRAASWSFSYTDPTVANSLATGTFDVTGNVSFGVLGATLSLDIEGQTIRPLVTPFSSALWRDDLTINAAGGGTFVMSFILNGHAATGPVTAGVQSLELLRFYGGLTPAGAPPFTDYNVTNSTFSTTYTSTPIPFVPGVPIEVIGTMGTNIRLNCVGATCDTWSGSGTFDFGHTALLNGIAVYDASGAPITDFSIQSSSGARYDENGVVPVPEPSSVLLLGAGMAGLIRARMRRR